MPKPLPSVFKVIPTTQQYDWGKIGLDSKVAQLASQSDIPGFTLDETSPYAELWMGTHITSPSLVLSTKQPLSEHLVEHPHLISKPVRDKFESYETSKGNLPFLFKVLSINKSLSIQTHPDEKTAQELFRTQGDIYKDPHHKPEMAIALTPFLALCGFQPLTDIAHNFESTPEVAFLIPDDTLEEFRHIADSSTPTGPVERVALKNLFSSLMTASEAQVKEQLGRLIERYKKGKLNKNEKQEIVDLVLRLESQFPGDVGVFCPLMLNLVKLQPGQAIFLGAGEPHAYIEGNIMECMANSDNVIRAGLTPKLRDIPNLVSNLTYKAAPPNGHLVEPSPLRKKDKYSTLYNPPIPEFAVIKLVMGRDESASHEAIKGPSIAIVTEGSGLVIWAEDGGKDEELRVGLGDVLFVGCDHKLAFKSDEGMVLYRAFVSID